MTIEKGEPWGSPFDGEPPRLRAFDDADLARLAHEQRSAGESPAVLVGQGDVAATIGADAAEPDDEPGAGRYHRYPMDLGYVALADRAGLTEQIVPFVAHVVGHRHRALVRRWSPWPELIVMNTPLLSGLRLGPRAHPNDGKLDVTVGSLPWLESREARRRAATGTHLPHPRLDVTRTSRADLLPDRPLHVEVDGVDRGRWSQVTVTVVPDAFVLVARVA